MKQPQVHLVGEDGRNVYIEVQGSLLAVAFRGRQVPRPIRSRGEVGLFSRESRLRLLKRVARIDWQAAGRSTFATVTWRDSCGRPCKDQLGRVRREIHRRLEERIGPTAALWRVEWQPRKRGRYLGQPMPHIHYIYWGVPYIVRARYRDDATVAMGADDEVRVDLQEIACHRDLMYYVSKKMAYVAKPVSVPADPANAKDVSISCLVNAAYLKLIPPHRTWGHHRRNMLPLASLTCVRTMPGPLIDEIRRVAYECWSGVPMDEDAGFTTFGPAADRVKKILQGYVLDGDVITDMMPLRRDPDFGRGLGDASRG